KALTTSTLVVATAGAGAVGVHLYNAQHDADDRAAGPATTTRSATTSRAAQTPQSKATSGSSHPTTRRTTTSTATATTSTSRPVVQAQQPARTRTQGS
ncbi:MAG: hypothetical protein M0Z51_10500, partial [Propionibacterium sp.]|nr:hypothetical protein [Propionibacterium sp.]